MLRMIIESTRWNARPRRSIAVEVGEESGRRKLGPRENGRARVPTSRRTIRPLRSSQRLIRTADEPLEPGSLALPCAR